MNDIEGNSESNSTNNQVNLNNDNLSRDRFDMGNGEPNFDSETYHQDSDTEDASVVMSIEQLFFNNEYDVDDSENSSEESHNFDPQQNDLQEHNNKKFINDIHNFCSKNLDALPHNVINELLGVLRENTNAPFPKDARTLLHTPRYTDIEKMSDEKGLWIISVSETVMKQVEPVGIYCGQEKPGDSDVLLEKFNLEMKNIIEN
ncbi:hypothetical protein TKK_0019065 [Trichogramma kaykai]